MRPRFLSPVVGIHRGTMKHDNPSGVFAWTVCRVGGRVGSSVSGRVGGRVGGRLGGRVGGSVVTSRQWSRCAPAHNLSYKSGPGSNKPPSRVFLVRRFISHPAILLTYQRKERIRHWCRCEPLVTVQVVAVPWPTTASTAVNRGGNCRVRLYIRSTLPLRHRHPKRHTSLFGWFW